LPGRSGVSDRPTRSRAAASKEPRVPGQCFLDPAAPASYDFFPAGPPFPYEVLISMLAVIGNVIAGLLALSLFTATVRLTK
jgi:hypothetical protein